MIWITEPKSLLLLLKCGAEIKQVGRDKGYANGKAPTYTVLANSVERYSVEPKYIEALETLGLLKIDVCLDGNKWLLKADFAIESDLSGITG